MTKENILILKSGADLLIQKVSESISLNPENKEQGRAYLKSAISASESLDSVEAEDEESEGSESAEVVGERTGREERK